ITMGIVLVAFLAARASFVPPATMTSTLRRTNSLARAGAARAYFQRIETRSLCSCPRHSRFFVVQRVIWPSNGLDREIPPTKNRCDGFYLAAGPGRNRRAQETWRKAQSR